MSTVILTFITIMIIKVIPFIIFLALLSCTPDTEFKKRMEEQIITESQQAMEQVREIERKIDSIPDTLSGLERLQKEVELRKQAIETELLPIIRTVFSIS